MVITFASTSGLYSAKKAFVAAESSEKIKRAIKANVRPCGAVFEIGSKVFYNKENKLHGPANVLGQDGLVVFLRHAGSFLRIHSTKICVRDEQTYSHESRSKTMDPEETEKKVSDACADDEDTPQDVPLESTTLERSNEPSENQNCRNSPLADDNTMPVNKKCDFRPVGDLKLRSGDTIKCLDGDATYCATVKSRAGKVTGVHKNWYNISSPESNNVMAVCHDIGI